MCSPACILGLVATAVVRGEAVDVWRWSDDPELSEEKTAQEVPVEPRVLPEVPNGNSTPQAKDGGHMDEDGVQARQRRSRGRKRVGSPRVGCERAG